MLLSVQDQFVPKIQDGTKPFSIRAFRKDRRIPKPGEKIFMYHGSRYAKGKRPRVFPQGMEPTISFTNGIEIDANYIRITKVSCYNLDKLPLLPNDFEIQELTDEYGLFRRASIIAIDKFSYMDGFDCFADQLAFFEKLYGLPFSGLIIFWKLHPEYLRRRNAGQ